MRLFSRLCVLAEVQESKQQLLVGISSGSALLRGFLKLRTTLAVHASALAKVPAPLLSSR